ncbi:hypothetical protein ABFS82_02G046300 [Erythranthe guttata]|uniref:Phytosulfokine n=1 Tax=Erythranthe guttata TaxID=4155 RepID=A0A022RBC7_ERYGU|nr:hypothetical protein MIMGU_mgv1a020195mg [Erythranthe guttata]
MGKAMTITIMFLLVAFPCVLARPDPTFHDVTPMETRHGENEVQKVDAVDRDRCVGLGEDECLMRRTLDAHIDYIYTHKRKQSHG